MLGGGSATGARHGTLKRRGDAAGYRGIVTQRAVAGNSRSLSLPFLSSAPSLSALSEEERSRRSFRL